MKLVRSWPEVVPEGRSYVVDDLPRLMMRDYNYDCLRDLDDDVVLVEWDIAVGMEELEDFIRRAEKTPEKVLAAPYRLYVGLSTRLPHPEWTAWRYRNNDQVNGGRFPVSPGTPTAHLTSFGLTYIPGCLIEGYMETRDRAVDGKGWRFSDLSFFAWHFRCVTQEIELDWDTRPVHLHYKLSDEIRAKVRMGS